MKVITFTIIGIGFYLVTFAQQNDPSVLFGNIYRGYGAELHPGGELIISYKLFKQDSSLFIGTYHPKGSQYRKVIDSISQPIVSIYDWSISNSSWIDINENGFYYTGSNFFPYEKIEKLPYPVVQKLYGFASANSSNYFQEFLNMTVSSICVDQLDVFDAIDGNTIGYLVRDDLVEVLDTQGDWVQVKFLKTDVVYWTYMSCLE